MAKRNIILGAVSFLFFSGVSLSALMIETPLPELVRRAAHIVEGEVVSLHCYWNDERSMIFTDIEVTVRNRLKGAGTQRRLIVRIPGGEVDGMGYRESDTPVFFPGESVILFLNTVSGATGPESRRLGVNRFELVDRAQGKYTVLADGMAVNGGYHLAPEFREGGKAYHIKDFREMIGTCLDEETVR